MGSLRSSLRRVERMILQEAKRSMKGLLGLALGYQHARDSCVYFERVTEQWQLVRAPPWIPEVAGSTLTCCNLTPIVA